MRLLRLEGEDLGGRVIDLHPEISVLTDLDDDLRDRLLRACRALPAGEDPGCGGLIEAHGVLFDLGPESLNLLGFDEPLDVVVAAPDLGDSTHGPSTIAVLDAAAAELRRQQSDLDQRRLELVAQLESAREALETSAGAAHEQPPAGVGVSPKDARPGDLTSEQVAPESLRERLTELERIDRELQEIDGKAIAALLEAVLADEGDDPRTEEAGRLAVELRQIDTELADLESALEAQGLHPDEVGRRRDALTIDVARLESEHTPRTIDPDDRAALEAAQNEVLEAEERMGGSLLGGRSAERRMEQAIDARQEILDRIGLPTYSAFVMAVTVGSVDPTVERELEQARKDLEATEAEFAEAVDLLEKDPARSMLNLRSEEIVTRAAELLGRDPGPDVVGELLAFKSAREATATIDDLRHHLEREGLLVPGLELTDTEVCELAAAWLEEMAIAVLATDERVAEEAELRDRLAAAEREGVATEGAEPQPAEAVQPADATRARPQPPEDLESSGALVADLSRQLDQVAATRQEIEARLEAQDALAELARPQKAPAEPTPSTNDHIDAVRTMMRGRLSDHRRRSFAGGVPMVICGVFDRFDRDTVGRLLTELAETAEGVQIIILDDELPVVTWATSVGFPTAAVVSPE